VCTACNTGCLNKGRFIYRSSVLVDGYPCNGNANFMAQEAKILSVHFRILHEIKDIDRYKGLKFTNMMLNATDDDDNFYGE